MSRVSKFGFLNARIRGVYARSFLDERAVALTRFTSVLEAAKVLVPEGTGFSAEGGDLLGRLEHRLEQERIDELVRVLALLGEPEPFLIHAVRSYEYRNVKVLRKSLGSQERASYWELGPYETVRLGASNLQEAVAGTEFAWLADRGPEDSFSSDLELDKQYFRGLEDLASGLDRADRLAVLPLVREELLFEALSWLFRLRRFYGISGEEALDRLAGLGSMPSASLVKRAALLPLDDAGPWRAWKLYWAFQNQDLPDFRMLDVSALERGFRRRLKRRYRLGIHKTPFTLGPLYSFLRLKQVETANLRGALEGLAMGMAPAEIRGILEV